MTYDYQIRQQTKFARSINFGLAAIFALIMIGMLVGSFYFLYSVSKYKPVITLITYEETTYQCTHYANGNMSCFDVDDPDVGFGRQQP